MCIRDRNYVKSLMHKKIHMPYTGKMCINMWIMWITYFPRRCSPIFTTSPAPIVIRRSPLEQFSRRKFSISSKVGKYSHGVPSSCLLYTSIYFALRMAAGELLCGQESFPVILDDVFGMYDEERLCACLLYTSSIRSNRSGFLPQSLWQLYLIWE